VCITNNYFLDTKFALRAYQKNYNFANFLQFDFSKKFIFYPEYKLEKNLNATKVYYSFEEAKKDGF
jgi:hypothetical protein